MFREIVKNWKLKVKTYEDAVHFLMPFSIEFAYHSSKMEDPAITFENTKRIFNNSTIVEFTGDLKTILEIKNNKDGIDLGFDMLKQGAPIDLDLIKRFHYRLTKYTYDERIFNVNKERPGEFRNLDYIKGVNDIGSASGEVEKDLQALLDTIAKEPEENVLHAAAYFHARFENIHPFADGNGDVGRILTNYLLLLNHHPPIIFFEDTRKQYIEALRSFDQDGSLLKMEAYMEEQILKTWKDHEELMA